MILAEGKLGENNLVDIPVINPGSWFGKTWLVEIGPYHPLFLIVEADNIRDAIDELAEDKKYGHNIIIPEENLDEYTQDEYDFGPNGELLDIQYVRVYGNEGAKTPFKCRYFGDKLPVEGILPTEYDSYN